MIILAGILLVVGLLWLILSPIVAGKAAPLADGPDRLEELRELKALREIAYETLRDIEFDYHAGKIGEADHRELTARYKAEALAIVRRIDALEEPAADPAASSPAAAP
jgi:hypothetical protein